MILKEKERSVIEDLQTQEKSCVEKYGKYAEQARDPELKNLFRNIQQEEQKHYESLSMILSGSVKFVSYYVNYKLRSGMLNLIRGRTQQWMQT